MEGITEGIKELFLRLIVKKFQHSVNPLFCWDVVLPTKFSKGVT